MRDNPIGRLSGWVIFIFAAAFTIFGLPRQARAEDVEDPEYGSTYARVRYVEGEATLLRFVDGEVIQAEINDPLESGDRSATLGGRLEIGLADGATLWLDERTAVDLRSLSDVENLYEQTNLLALIEGSIRIDTGDPAQGDSQFQIDTEGGSIYLLSAGSFRIDAERGVTTVSSFRGVAELSGDLGSVMVRSGERASVQAGGGPSEARAFNTLRLDDFDRFHDERVEAYLRRGGDAPIDEIRAAVPVSVRPYILELSVYGGWHHHGAYGWVWRPAYHGDWGPYVSGRWVWYPTGWVWVSYDPWGWAPYHYGRWDYAIDLGWVWIPGARWSGAWVSFAVGSTYIGWSPLNYYNYPVFHHGRYNSGFGVHAHHLHQRGWRFSKVGLFAAQHGVGKKHGVGHWLTLDRIPRDTDVVITGGLPRFNPKRVAGHEKERRTFIHKVRESRASLPAVGPSGSKVPFHKLERERSRTIRRTTTTLRESGRRQGVGSSRERMGRPAVLQDRDPVMRGPKKTKDRSRGDTRVMKRLPRAEKRDPVVKRLMRGIKSDRSRSTWTGKGDSRGGRHARSGRNSRSRREVTSRSGAGSGASKSRATARSSSSSSRSTSKSRVTSSSKGASKSKAKSRSSRSTTSKSKARSRSSKSGKSKGSVRKSGSKPSSKSTRSKSSRSSSRKSSSGRSSSRPSSSRKP